MCCFISQQLSKTYLVVDSKQGAGCLALWLYVFPSKPNEHQYLLCFYGYMLWTQEVHVARTRYMNWHVVGDSLFNLVLHCCVLHAYPGHFASPLLEIKMHNFPTDFQHDAATSKYCQMTAVAVSCCGWLIVQPAGAGLGSDNCGQVSLADSEHLFMLFLLFWLSQLWTT